MRHLVWRRLRDRGFEWVDIDDLTMAEQAHVFSEAAIVVAGHGAARSNLVFCQQGTVVIGFFSPHYVNVTYWALANQMGLTHRYLLGLDPRPPANHTPPIVNRDILVDVKQLSGLLDTLRVRD